jgi:hypothetical protein
MLRIYISLFLSPKQIKIKQPKQTLERRGEEMTRELPFNSIW